MKSEYWRTHVERKGWAANNKIVPPEGKEVVFTLEGGGRIVVTPNNEATYDEIAINCVDCCSELPSDVAVRWQDVVGVECSTFIDLVGFFNRAAEMREN